MARSHGRFLWYELLTTDVAAANDPTHFVVTINGQAVAATGASYSPGANSVTLTLPPGSLHAGDDVQAGWLSP